MPVITVSQINRYLASKIGGDKLLQGILVKGEISNFVHHMRTGHFYFSVKDESSSIKAIMFKSAHYNLKFMPEDGMSAVFACDVKVYETGGYYQLVVKDIIPEGAGKQSVALDQLKKKLAAEGIFDQSAKQPLPHLPKKIGAVTSLTGAAIQDIIRVLSRRYPICELYAVDAQVQGENAPDSICRGLMRADNAGCDVIIVGRGGGSAEDLSPFNTEKVARAVYACKTPVISAVGHEVDFTLADLAADLRAPTPSAAAELAAPDIRTLMEQIETLEKACRREAEKCVGRAENSLKALTSALSAQSPENRLRLMQQQLSSLESRGSSAFAALLGRLDSRLNENIARLDSLSPLKVLERGYSLVYSGEKLVRSQSELSPGDVVQLHFHEGGAAAEIKEVW
jgi:exodeoxyribonuclease VII large subunit